MMLAGISITNVWMHLSVTFSDTAVINSLIRYFFHFQYLSIPVAFTKYVSSLTPSKTYKHDYTRAETLLWNNSMLCNSLAIQSYHNVYIQSKTWYD